MEISNNIKAIGGIVSGLSKILGVFHRKGGKNPSGAVHPQESEQTQNNQDITRKKEFKVAITFTFYDTKGRTKSEGSTGTNLDKEA